MHFYRRVCVWGLRGALLLASVRRAQSRLSDFIAPFIPAQPGTLGHLKNIFSGFASSGPLLLVHFESFLSALARPGRVYISFWVSSLLFFLSFRPFPLFLPPVYPRLLSPLTVRVLERRISDITRMHFLYSSKGFFLHFIGLFQFWLWISICCSFGVSRYWSSSSSSPSFSGCCCLVFFFSLIGGR